jgi:molybdate transport system ATP-binding protein
LARRLNRSRPPRLEAIELERASVRLGHQWALREVTWDIRAGQRWLLTGHNGSGKSVLLKLLRGDVWPTPTGHERRRYRLDGEWQEQSLEARGRIAYLGPERQDRYDRYELNARVEEVVATGLSGDDLLLEQPGAAQWRDVRRALRDVGLAGLAARRFLTLSHGQRRRALLARALVGRPDVLLLDEVLNGLDAGSRRRFLTSLREASGPHLAWILATHRLAERPRGITHVARIEHGRVAVDSAAATRALRRSRHDAASPGQSGNRATARRSGTPVSEPLLQLTHASVHRDGRRVLGPLDWTLADGEHWHIAGPNGAGKSTLVALLYGDLPAAGGSRVERRGCPRGTPIATWKGTVGLVSPELQSTYAATACTAAEIVLSGLHSSIGLDEVPTTSERALARRWLARLGLRGLEQRRARELSYGQLRRALVARALIARRQLLLLDEPYDGLDAATRELVAAQFALAVRRGAQVVLATHHRDDVPSYVTQRLMLPVRGARAAR